VLDCWPTREQSCYGEVMQPFISYPPATNGTGVGPYPRDQSGSGPDSDDVGGGTTKPRLNQTVVPLLTPSANAAQTAADSGSATAVGEELCMGSAGTLVCTTDVGDNITGYMSLM